MKVNAVVPIRGLADHKSTFSIYLFHHVRFFSRFASLNLKMWEAISIEIYFPFFHQEPPLETKMWREAQLFLLWSSKKREKKTSNHIAILASIHRNASKGSLNWSFPGLSRGLSNAVLQFRSEEMGVNGRDTHPRTSIIHTHEGEGQIGPVFSLPRVLHHVWPALSMCSMSQK